MRGSDGRRWCWVAFEDGDTGPMVFVAGDDPGDLEYVAQWIRRLKGARLRSVEAFTNQRIEVET